LFARDRDRGGLQLRLERAQGAYWLASNFGVDVLALRHRHHDGGEEELGLALGKELVCECIRAYPPSPRLRIDCSERQPDN
jgi:hypothetical protein